MLDIEKYVTASPEQLQIIIEGTRNPMNSWNMSDSRWEWVEDPSPINPDDPGMTFVIGDKDKDLMLRLSHAGSDHRKFMRMIPVWITLTAPLYWWKEFDTYKVGTVANSCSTMHKIHAREFTINDFSHDHLTEYSKNILLDIVDTLNLWRHEFLSSGEKSHWEQLIQLLPSSYNQKRTVLVNYETLHNIYHARRNHKLTEWHTFCDFIENLPYSELITGEATDNLCTT